MDHAVTVRDVLEICAMAVGAIVIVGLLLYVLAAFGRGMSR